VEWRCIERVRIYEVKSNPADLCIAAVSVGLSVHQSTNKPHFIHGMVVASLFIMKTGKKNFIYF